MVLQIIFLMSKCVRNHKKRAPNNNNQSEKPAYYDDIIFVIHVAQMNGGNPKSSGSNSSILLSRIVASCVRRGSMLSSGTITTCIPAASAALTPLGASSKTKHCTRTEEKKLFYPLSLLGLQDSSASDIAQLWAEKQSRKMGINGPGSILVWWTWYFLRVIVFSFVRWDIHSIDNKQSVRYAMLHWICVLLKYEAVLFVIHIFFGALHLSQISFPCQQLLDGFPCQTIASWAL